MNEICIRRMQNGELREVAALWRRSRLEALPALEERLRHSGEDDLQHLFTIMTAGYEIWLAAESLEILGMMARKGDELDKLYVEPSEQRRGIGSLLLDKAKADSPSGIKLYTHQANSKARAFYEARGFQATTFGVSPAPESEPDVSYVWNSKGP